MSTSVCIVGTATPNLRRNRSAPGATIESGWRTLITDEGRTSCWDWSRIAGRLRKRDPLHATLDETCHLPGSSVRKAKMG